jgi:hypothetical protein
VLGVTINVNYLGILIWLLAFAVRPANVADEVLISAFVDH